MATAAFVSLRLRGMLRFLDGIDLGMSTRAGIFGLALVLSVVYVTWGIGNTCVFLGDQGQAALVLRQIHEEGEVPLLGPPAGFNGRYFGPAYYYLLYLPYLLFDFDPVAGGYFTACFDLMPLAALLFYLSLRQGLLLPLISFCAFALSPGIFRELRTQWNPNLLPGLLCLFLLAALAYRQAASDRWRMGWGAVLGVTTGVALQLHTTAFPLVPALAFVLGQDAFDRQRSSRARIRSALVIGFSAATVFLPTLIQGLQDDFQNLRLYFSFLEANSRDVYGSWGNFIRLVSLGAGPWYSAFGTYPGIFAYGFLVPLAALSIHRKGWQSQESLLFGLQALVVVSFLLGLANYRGQILAYYLVMLLPVPFVFAAAIPPALSTLPLRRAAALGCGLLMLLPVPSALAENNAYLTLRPDSHITTGKHCALPKGLRRTRGAASLEFTSRIATPQMPPITSTTLAA
jgi:hypothetical protein